MNTELKALLDLVFDSEALIVKIIAKQNFFTLLPQVFQILSADLPNAVLNWADLSAEIKAFQGSAAEADLVAYIEAKFAGAWSNGKAGLVLAAVLKLIVDMAQDALALQAAIKA